MARGNHDRPHDGDAWASCSTGRWGGHDCFVDEFFPSDAATYFADDLHGLRTIGLDTYDKADDPSEVGLLSPDQMEWFRDW